jgi:DNA-binding MarR family transcriptional regulator
MAKLRDCSRQHVQATVNSLAEAGLVEFVPNPGHRRSHLVRVTDRGRSCAAETQRRERRILSGLQLEAEAEDLRQAVRVLERVRQALTGARWRHLIESESGMLPTVTSS